MGADIVGAINLILNPKNSEVHVADITAHHLALKGVLFSNQVSPGGVHRYLDELKVYFTQTAGQCL